jgi:hypothetical protein
LTNNLTPKGGPQLVGFEFTPDLCQGIDMVVQIRACASQVNSDRDRERLLLIPW